MTDRERIVAWPSSVGELVFTNSDARPKVAALKVDRAVVPQIMAWYGAFHAGDRYRVTFDGELIAKDQNGEPIERGEHEEKKDGR